MVTARVAVPASSIGGQAVGERDGWAAAALREALHTVGAGPSAVGTAGGGEAVAVVSGTGEGESAAALADGLREIWPVLGALTPRTPVHCGVGSVAADARGLRTSLTTARHARAGEASARPDRSGLRTSDDLRTLGDLLDGIPAEVRAAFHQRVLGALTAQDGKTHGALMETLETFLAHDGSWSRSAEVLHVHVNTVHYRLQRIEQLTGRDLSRLSDRLDLRTALLCRPVRP
jgi:sugar diacid utilization regulator